MNNQAAILELTKGHEVFISKGRQRIKLDAKKHPNITKYFVENWDSIMSEYVESWRTHKEQLASEEDEIKKAVMKVVSTPRREQLPTRTLNESDWKLITLDIGKNLHKKPITGKWIYVEELKISGLLILPLFLLSEPEES